ncbi:copper amine oxidase N-terminal domain-containing protein [Paenibacillus bouchesdurhonensis]|uniref:copper amine oxidase N-terminal domain-containing protein n=1 Tax=Paenibacillus bouchesdurhonensis TaxID=1870990 RepID=UPI000DA6146D|nr:copper amine oxidase N-terminal domain-containing protein [Paenibacillus bouchesdurhonensis]
MKKTFKKTLVSSLSVALLSMSAAGMVSAANGASTTSVKVAKLIHSEAIKQEEAHIQQFIAISGIIQEISDYVGNENKKLVTMKSADDSITNFVVSDTTYMMDELLVGTEMMAFFDQKAPALLIYPPQYNAVMMAAVKEERTVVVDRFSSDLVNASNTLKLILSEDTNIIAADGTAYEGEIADRLLAVTYTVSTRSIPAQTNPVQIIVLDKEQAVEEKTEAKAAFGEVRGTIKSINPKGKNNELQFVEVQLADESTVYLNVSEQTFVDEKLEVGAEITAFYNAEGPMLAIYPPQYNAAAIALVKEERNILVDRFDNTLKNAANDLVLKIGEDSKVLTTEGKAYEGSLKNQKLFVEYGITTRSLPAQTTPIRIVVLEEEAAPIEKKTFNVDGKAIAAPAAFLNEDGVVMVPIREIVEALGYEIGWDDETSGITVGKAISLQVGKDAYVFAKMAPVELGTAPVIVDGNTFVPLHFFTDIAQASDAYVNNTEVVIKK